jgi:hypothetical protein
VAEVTDPRSKPMPACTQPGCGAAAGDRTCYTASGWRRHPHAVRMRALAAADAGEPEPKKPAGRLARQRPTHKQADILAAAIHNGGLFETCEWPISGAALTRAAVYAMADEARGWMTDVRATRDGWPATPTG